MRLFGLSLIATFACALFSAAAPIGSLPSSNLDARGMADPSSSSAAGRVHSDLRSIPDVLNFVQTRFARVRSDLDAIPVSKDVSPDQVWASTQSIQTIIADAIATVRAIVALNPVGFIVTFNGRPIALTELPRLYYNIQTDFANIAQRSTALFTGGQGSLSNIQGLITANNNLFSDFTTLVISAVGGILPALLP